MSWDWQGFLRRGIRDKMNKLKVTGLVLFYWEQLSRSWRKPKEEGIKMGVSDTGALRADTRSKWKCAFLGRPCTHLSDCNQMMELTAAFAQSERTAWDFPSALWYVAYIYISSLFYSWGIHCMASTSQWDIWLHQKGASLISIQWVKNSATFLVFIVGGGANLFQIN